MGFSCFRDRWFDCWQGILGYNDRTSAEKRLLSGFKLGRESSYRSNMPVSLRLPGIRSRTGFVSLARKRSRTLSGLPVALMIGLLWYVLETGCISLRTSGSGYNGGIFQGCFVALKYPPPPREEVIAGQSLELLAPCIDQVVDVDIFNGHGQLTVYRLVT